MYNQIQVEAKVYVEIFERSLSSYTTKKAYSDRKLVQLSPCNILVVIYDYAVLYPDAC